MRIHTKYYVTREQFQRLKEIAACTYINGERDNARKIGSLPPEEDESINFGGHFFFVSESGECGKNTYCNKIDLARIISEIDKLQNVADYVIVSIHSHQIRRVSYTEPDYFLEEFAHKCIESGASAIIGSGTHQLKPIEIYNGKPIFYSLGNFVFQPDKVKELPADFWDKYNFPEKLTLQEVLFKRTRGGTIGLETDKSNYLSVIPLMQFEDKTLVSLELLPLSLGFEVETELKGLPFVASEADRRRIYFELMRISEQYGTKLKFNKKNNIEVILY